MTEKNHLPTILYDFGECEEFGEFGDLVDYKIEKNNEKQYKGEFCVCVVK